MKKYIYSLIALPLISNMLFANETLSNKKNYLDEIPLNSLLIIKRNFVRPTRGSIAIHFQDGKRLTYNNLDITRTFCRVFLDNKLPNRLKQYTIPFGKFESYEEVLDGWNVYGADIENNRNDFQEPWKVLQIQKFSRFPLDTRFTLEDLESCFGDNTININYP